MKGATRPVLPWRTRPAAWLTLPAVAGAALFAARFVDRDSVRGYWPAVIGASAIFLLFSCTLAGVAAAIEASRMRRSRLDQTPAARSALRVLLLLLRPCYLAGMLVQLAAIVGLSIGTWDAPGQPPLLLLVAYAAILAVHTALGYALGRALPLPAAIPIAVVASFVWLGFTGSTTYFPLRWLAGYALNSCCDIAYQPIPTTALAAIAFSALAAIALLIYSRPRNGRPTRPSIIRTGVLSVAGLTGALLLGLAIAPNTSQAGTPRPASETRCSGARPAVCLFPEQLAGNDQSVRTLTYAAQNLRAAGLSVPATLTTAVNPPKDALSLVVKIDEPPALLIHSLVASSLPDPSIGSECSEARATESFAVYGTAEHWLSNIASRGLLPPDAVPATSGDLGYEAAAQLADLPKRDQVAWFQHNLAALNTCHVPLRKVPQQ